MIDARFLGLALVVATLGGLHALAQRPPRDAREVKAAWLFNFARYITWPEDAVPDSDDTLIISVFGPNPFGPHLDNLAGREVQQRKVVIRTFHAARDYEPCHILVISPQFSELGPEQTPQQRLSAIQSLMPRGVLIVTDTPGLAAAGSMINYSVNPQGLIQLEVNRRAVDAARLQIDARLLNLPIIRFV
jgi:hypothetical protein